MKGKNWLLIALILVFAIVGIEGGMSFFSNHSYYATMFNSGSNRGLMIAALVMGTVPLGYYYLAEKPRLWGLTLSTAASLGIFALLHGMIKGYLIDTGAGISLVRNMLLFFSVAIGIFWGIWTLGHWIVRMTKLFENKSRSNLLLTFGLGLVVFLVLMQILMGLGLFLSPVVRGILVILWILSYFEVKKQKEIWLFIQQSLEAGQAKLHGNLGILASILIVLTFAYFFFGFVHSYIPYPTARDANHEYLYIPKVIMENGGILWGNQGAASGMPYLWHSFIAFAFSVRSPLTKLTNIAADTFAVNMNFWSGILVLIYGLASFTQVQKLFSTAQDEHNHNQTSFLLWWGFLLLWLTSGMGAFLLFVDNKTDMGVLLLSVIGLLAGLKAMRGLFLNAQGSSTRKYFLLSALFFAFGVMAKPTAFIDAVMFGLLLVGFWLNWAVALGSGAIVLGLMGILQPLNAVAFMNPSLGKVIIVIGSLIALIGTFFAIRKQKKEKADFKTAFLLPLQQILLWGATFIIAILLFKLPWQAYTHFKKGQSLAPWKLLEATILGFVDESEENEIQHQPSKFLLAQNADIADLQAQNHIDEKLEESRTAQLSLAQCKAEEFSTADLEKNKQQAPGGALLEDFGRYVGFGAKRFERSGVAGLVLKLLFWKENACYGLNADAVLLCKQKASLEQGNFQILAQVIPQLNNPDWPVAKLIQAIPEAGNDPAKLQDARKALLTYIQEHSIETTKDAIFVPYRYLVPFNAIFNRSLQNLSSYYTDIGLIWIFVLIALVAAGIYAIVEKKRKLLLITLITLVAWAIWWTIAAGILRYGLGLVVWSIVTVILWTDELLKKEEKSDGISRALHSAFLLIFVMLMALQMAMNLIRIASQATEWPFGQYKAGVGEVKIIGQNLLPESQIKRDFNAQDIFKLQFGQYLPFIDALKDRKDEDGVRIAGTYLPYFLHNQKNIRMDNLLTALWEEMSDYNSCKSYHRLRNQHIKYLVIDPNIGTVGRVGQGNESLFHRFFAKLNKQESQILTPWTITMLVNLHQDGYLKLHYTNNLGAKYAFSLTDAELKEVFGEMDAEALTLLRGKLAVAKFFISQQDYSLLEQVLSLFQKRLASPKVLEDLANLMNLQIDFEKVQNFIKNPDPKQLASRSNDERQLMSVYLPLIQGKVDPQWLMNLLQQSILGSSQIIALQLED